MTALPATATQAPAIQVIDLGTLASDGTSGNSVAWLIDQEGRVVGNSTTDDGRWLGFVWQAGRMTDLAPDSDRSAVSALSPRNGWILVDRGLGDDRHWSLWHQGETTDLGTIDGAPIYGSSVNSNGLVTGYAYSETSDRLALLWENGEVTDVGKAVGCAEFADIGSLNDRNEGIVSCGREGEETLYLWREGQASNLSLPIPDTWRLRTVGGIDNRGEIHGTAFDETWQKHVVVWRRGRMVDLGVIDFELQQLTERGDMTGRRYVTNEGDHAIIRINGREYDLGELTSVSNLNKRRQTVYTTGVSVWEPDPHPFLWQGGVSTPLPLPPGVSPDTNASAAMINDRGQIVGYLESPPRALLWQLS